MSSIAIMMMIIALVIIWGGLIASFIRLPKEDNY
ncbi:MAG: methionine/alanine import family NSS transporter small subunit [Pasteurellaceae bacterium]|nr:methionine/alanine import family NSS transporter small subunit [Pasteurellaceae bacterium]